MAAPVVYGQIEIMNVNGKSKLVTQLTPRVKVAVNKFDGNNTVYVHINSRNKAISLAYEEYQELCGLKENLDQKLVLIDQQNQPLGQQQAAQGQQPTQSQQQSAEGQQQQPAQGQHQSVQGQQLTQAQVLSLNHEYVGQQLQGLNPGYVGQAMHPFQGARYEHKPNAWDDIQFF